MNKSPIHPGRAALVLLTLLGATPLSWANTAANAGTINTTSVGFTGPDGPGAIDSSLLIVTGLLPSSPMLSTPNNQIVASGATATYNYAITATANGPETYSLSLVQSPTAGLTGSSAKLSVNTVTLGATTLLSLAAGNSINGVLDATTVVNVPADMTAGDPTVNGLAAGQVVIIDGVAFTISNVVASNNGTARALDQITLKGTGTASIIPAVGDLIAQQQSFTLTVNAGSNTSPATGQTNTVLVTATDPQHPAATSSSSTVTTVAGAGATKYVRNVSVAMPGTGAPLALAGSAGASYFAAGVTGNRGDIMEYLIQIVRSNGSSGSTSLMLSDPLPDSVSYLIGSLKYDGCNGGASFSRLSDAQDADAGSFSNNTVILYQSATPARLAPGVTAVTCNLLYQVRLK